MYYDRGRHIEQGCGPRRPITKDYICYNCRPSTARRDVVSRSDGFETTATRTPVSRSMSIVFLDELVKAGSRPPLLWEFLHQTP